MGFLVVSSILVVVLLSLNKSRSPCTAAVLAPPPPPPAAAGACVRVLTKLLELTLKEETDPYFFENSNENMEKKTRFTH